MSPFPENLLWHCKQWMPLYHLRDVFLSFKNKKLWFIYTMEYYVAMRKNELGPFVTTWMELESVMLSEISQSEKDKYHMISVTCGI